MWEASRKAVAMFTCSRGPSVHSRSPNEAEDLKGGEARNERAIVSKRVLRATLTGSSSLSGVIHWNGKKLSLSIFTLRLFLEK